MLLLLFWTVVVGWAAGAGVAATSLRAAARILAFCSGVNCIDDNVCSKFAKLVAAGAGAGAAVVVVVVVDCVSIRSTRAFIDSSWEPNSAKALLRGLKCVL